MKSTSRPAIRNLLVAVVACVLSYLVLSGALLIEANFTSWGELLRAESGDSSTETIAGEIDPFVAMKGWLVRFRVLYLPLAVLLPALFVAKFAQEWSWTWLVALFGCLPGLIALALTTGENLGVGILIAFATYLVIGTAVSWWRYKNERLST